MTLEQAFQTFAQANQLQYNLTLGEDHKTNVLDFRIDCNVANFSTVGFLMEDDRLFVYLVDLGIKVNHIETTAVLLNQLNQQLKVGTFQIDPSLNTVVFKLSQYIYGSDEEQSGLMGNVVFIAGNIANNNYKSLVTAMLDS